MTKFSRYSKANVADRTAEYIMTQLGDRPVLVGRIAGEGNKRYFSALLGKANQHRRRPKVDVKMIQADREEDCALYAKYVIIDWRGVKDDNGDEVPFGPEVCEEFLQQIPTWVFDDVRGFFTNPFSFVDEDDEEAEDDVDVEEAVGNSPSALSGS